MSISMNICNHKKEIMQGCHRLSNGARRGGFPAPRARADRWVRDDQGALETKETL
ncbi:unnamed protein product [Penicillium salamii]|uniref:Uncharacterized protein n=1 Tax=Penicillium salamii TaxID=1612424 RepID=A0A9W4IPI2_9EURO|nr:unnamed protein product [Penicillium salamii]CAG8065724.1 unnamed protein product [Penicillium salamii]CAG8260617.1 unnamed protein product [Penicillium salamii]CAG8313954.1 unnamed protein product [Penicillium salamii]CAG8321594.1 unnamed protein product [Penicillium salamii]